MSPFRLKVELVEGLLVWEVEIMAHILCTQEKTVLYRNRFVAMGHEFTVKQRTTHAVPERSSRSEQGHAAGSDILVVYPLDAFVGGAKQKKVALFKVQPNQSTVEALAQKSPTQFKHLRYVQARLGNGCFNHVLQRLETILRNGKTVGHGFEEESPCFAIGHFIEVLQKTNHNHVLFVPLQAFVDLAACAKELDAQLGQSLGLHRLPLSGHALKLIDEFVEAGQAVVHKGFGELIPHVPRSVGTPKRNALFPASGGKQGKQLDQCFENAGGHDLRTQRHSTQVAARRFPQGTLS